MRFLALTLGLWCSQLWGQPWGPLLENSLQEWKVWTCSPHKSIHDRPAGVIASDDGESCQSVGIGDPFSIFSFIKGEDGSSVLKVYGQVFGALTSNAFYENYHFSTQVKLGEKQWAPNHKNARNSGVLYLCYDPHGFFWNACMASLQVKYKEGAESGLIQLGGPYSLVKVDTDGAWSPEGEVMRKDRSVPGKESSGLVKEGWNQIDLYAFGDRAIHMLNGVTLLEVESSCIAEGEPLRSGKIQIQSEGAGVSFKNMSIRPLEEMPASL